MSKSILTDDETKCYICGRKATSMFSVFSSNINYEREEKAKKDGLTLPLCWECNVKLHQSPAKLRNIRKMGQLAWEDHHPGESFQKRYGRDYLWEYKKRRHDDEILQ